MCPYGTDILWDIVQAEPGPLLSPLPTRLALLQFLL